MSDIQHDIFGTPELWPIPDSWDQERYKLVYTGPDYQIMEILKGYENRQERFYIRTGPANDEYEWIIGEKSIQSGRFAPAKEREILANLKLCLEFL